MKLEVKLNDRSSSVKLERSDLGWTADVDGRRYELEASEPEANVFLLKRDGRVFEAAVSPATTGEYRVRIRDTEFAATVSDPKRLQSSSAGAADSAGRAEIKTAMPGKVVRILVETGQQVETGDGVVVVEAMKMQNEMKAPKSGTVVEIRAAENATVTAGEILIIIE